MSTQIAIAGRNANGALIVHTDDAVTYTATGDYCLTTYLPASCEVAVTRTDKDEDTPAVIWLLAAFPDTSSPAVTTIQFGIEHNLPPGEGYFESYGKCGALEMPDEGWPETGFGNLLSFGSTSKTELLFPFYWFAAYGFEGAYLGTRTYPNTDEAKFVDDRNPPVEDLVTRFGEVRWQATGFNECPIQYTGGEDDDDLEPPTGYEPPTEFLSLYLAKDALAHPQDLSNPVPVADVDFNYPRLRPLLMNLRAITIVKNNPFRSPQDTLGFDINGRAVRLFDTSRFHTVQFPTPALAGAAVAMLDRAPGIVHASMIFRESGHVAGPNDEHYDSINALEDITEDAEWHLRNDGFRTRRDLAGVCGGAEPGRDIGAEAAWYMTSSYGDSNTVIGIADTGILGGGVISGDPDSTHPDLRVVHLETSQRDQIQVHPNVNWCASHGTRMAGLAAAQTNNFIGVAGVCGRCAVLDIEVSKETGCACANHHDPDCGDIDVGLWSIKLENAGALTLPAPMKMVAVNMSFITGYGASSDHQTVMSCWNTYKRGIALVAACGDQVTHVPTSTKPANIPFILGVGGSTWQGRFWDWRSSSCYSDTVGSSVGPAEWPGGRGTSIDICAPASGEIATTDPSNHPTSGFYWTTSSEASGATAIVSGAIGLIQSAALHSFSEYLGVDDVVGIVEATARPFDVDPLSEPERSCTTCPREQYGKGIIDLEGAMELAITWHEKWAPLPDACEYVASAGNNNGTWTFDPVATFTIGDTTWVQYLITAGITVPRTWGSGSEERTFPARVAWVRRLSPRTNTYAGYPDDGRRAERIVLAHNGVHDCRMSVINQDTGEATLTGYAYGWRVGNSALTFLGGADSEHAGMAYVVPCNQASEVEGGRDDRSSGRCILRHVRRSEDGIWTLAWTMGVTADVRLGVYNVAGRRVCEIDLGHRVTGTYEVALNERTDLGIRVADGIYWVRLCTRMSSSAKRVVVIK
jgi:hypothetical protein